MKEKGKRDWWRRAEYLDDSGFESKCRVCPQERVSRSIYS